MLSDLGSRIRDIRMQRNLSISTLASRTGIAKSYISCIERNLKSNPSVDVLERLCTALGVELSALIGPGLERMEPDWIQLAHKAQQSGISKDEFLDFIRRHGL
ncbi:MAG: helix-turn-helix domain-containing protein [Alicyclobacillus sp.]|nr:helix-turn-helix domain-containing protein [Alicyclobacillus sp.]